MRFTQEFFIPLSSHLPFLSTRGSNLFCFSEDEIKRARLGLLALNMRAWLETVAYTSSNWIPWSSVIYCWHPLWSAAESPLGRARLEGGAQQFQPWAYPAFLTLALPSYLFPRIIFFHLKFLSQRFVRIPRWLFLFINFPQWIGGLGS